jgi:uncharacterized protein
MGSCRARGGLIALFFAVCGAGQAAAACSDASVELRNGKAVVRFNVEIADTDAERATGLMNREKLAASSGMLFVYPSPRHASFWMKNTLIPLDMIFVDSAGRVTKVHPLAKPRDLTQIDGGEGVAFVLEINGGLAKRLGIGAGSELRHPVVDQATAVWACNSE